MANTNTHELKQAIDKLQEHTTKHEILHEQPLTAQLTQESPTQVGAVHSGPAFRLCDADEMPICAGVYLIYCTRNRMRYYGSSLDVCRRAVSHRDSLRTGKHSNYRLQRAYRMFGEEAFTIELVEELPANTDDLVSREGHYIRNHRSHVFGLGFNIQRDADYRKDTRRQNRRDEPLIWLNLPEDK